jgi:hypothetical protein
MPKYIVERSFPAGIDIPATSEMCAAVMRRDAQLGVVWLHSYVSEDRMTSYCVYVAPTPDALRAAAAANDLPVRKITEVQVRDACFGL